MYDDVTFLHGTGFGDFGCLQVSLFRQNFYRAEKGLVLCKARKNGQQFCLVMTQLFANRNHVLNLHRVFGDRFHGSICMSIRVNPCKLDISEVTSAAPLSSAQQDQVWCAVVPFTFSTYF